MREDDSAAATPGASGFSPGEAYYRALVESVLDVVVVYNADGTFRYVSPSVRTVFDLGPEDVIGRPGLDFVHPDDVAGLRGALDEAGAHPGRSAAIEVRLRHRDGTYRLMESHVTSFLHEPAIAGLVVASRDVTEHRETAARLAHAQRMEAVGRLAETVAHEFKNALSVVVGHAELALERLPSDDGARASLEAIHRSATRAAATARRLLDFGRRDPAQQVPLDAGTALRGCATLLSPLLGRAVRLEVDVPGDAGSFLADPAELEQAVVNLVLNARDAMPEGGTVTLSARDAYLDTEEARRRPGLAAGRYVVLSVADTGPGIPPEVMKRLFEPFITTKPPGKGTGLGLAAVYGIARRSGGAAWAESAPGRGATFSVALPRLGH
jgi:two-component system cell cycle sensor histidine kinase/response regulator CckA